MQRRTVCEPLSQIVNQPPEAGLTVMHNCRGPYHEWHLDFDKAFGHIAFDLGAWLHHPGEVVVPPFLHAGFETVRTVSYSMSGDGTEQVLVERQLMYDVICLNCNHLLKGFQRLNGPFETDRSRQEIVRRRRLSHDRANQIVGQDVSPDLLAHQLRCLAP